MRHVFTTSREIASEFICGTFDSQEKRNKSNNASTNGESFWSYCTTIAKKYGEFVAMDSYFYSKTTDKQKREIRAAANDRFIIVELPQIFHLAAAENVEYLTKQIQRTTAKMRRARSDFGRLRWSAERNKFISFWGYMPALLRAAGYPETAAAAYRDR